MRIVSECEFAARLGMALIGNFDGEIGAVTGPGRSGAIAAFYASHLLRVPFIPFGGRHPAHLGQLLIVDTASETGRTLRKARTRYAEHDPVLLAVYQEPPRVAFWYEVPKPQRFQHERKAA